MKFHGRILRAVLLTQLAVTVFVTSNAAHALSLTFGNLIVTEFMSNPEGVSDTQGEWFELYNAGGSAIELNGLSVRDTSSAVGTLDFGGSFLLAPGQYASLARSVSAGFTPDGIYNSISLNNGGDEINILDGSNLLSRLIYGSGEGFAGASTAIDLGTQQWFSDTTNFYGLGNSGTPGLENMLGSEMGNPLTILPSPNVVPLPAGVWLLLSGIAMIAVRRKA